MMQVLSALLRCSSLLRLCWLDLVFALQIIDILFHFWLRHCLFLSFEFLVRFHLDIFVRGFLGKFTLARAAAV